MTPEQWQEAKRILAEALERAPQERRVYFDQVCTDPNLRRELESLIAAHEQEGSSFMEQSAVTGAHLQKGDKLGQYTIHSRIGVGGMGEVYRAHDPKLGRDVAIKVLPLVFVDDPERLARFQLEARTLASLNHANIATIHGLEQSEGLHYLVMELIVGQSLAERLRSGALPVKEVLDLGIQVVDALDAAHAKGIIHRDIKPANIVLTTRGQAKILDFGLAKLTRSLAAGFATLSTASTPEVSKSVPGVLLGTLAYMSPEQARGENLDVRTDLFSFGLVVYEMATGRAAFSGNNPGVIFDAILNRQPVPPSQLNRAVPPRLEEIITRAIEKDQKLRYQTAQDLEADLQRVKRDIESGSVRKVRPASLKRTRRYRHLSLVGGGVAFAGLALLLAVVTRSPAPNLGPRESYAITNDGRPKVLPGSFYPIVTDGERLYFTEMAAGGFDLAQVSTAGGETVSTSTPFMFPQVADISPNRSELLLLGFAGSEEEAPMWIIPTLAEAPRRAGDLKAHAATWSPDGEIVYANGFDLYRAKTDGSASRKFVALPGRAYWLRFSPDGRVLRLTVLDPTTKSTSLWEVSGDGRNLHALLPGWNEPAAECCGNWSPDGKYYAFQSSREGRADIWVLGERSSFSFSPSGTLDQVTHGPLAFLAPLFSLDGKTLFVVGEQRRGELVRYNTKTHQFLPYLSGISADRLDFSRDGGWIAYVSYPDETLWRCRVDGTQKQQLTFPPVTVDSPEWSPDGKQIAFSASKASEIQKIYVISAGGGSPVEILPGEESQTYPSWSPDGASLVFNGRQPGTAKSAIFLFNMKTGAVTMLPASDGLLDPRWSPDGSYIAAMTMDSQNLLLFNVQTKIWDRLAKIGIGYMSWSKDSKYLYFDTFGTAPSVVRIGLRDRAIEKVVDLGALRRTWGRYGPWLGLGPDDAPLASRDAGIQEIYAAQWSVSK